MACSALRRAWGAVCPLVTCSQALPACWWTGHYDVQPAMERDWKTDPFELHSIDGYFYARGASDNKASSSQICVSSAGNDCPAAGARWLGCSSASIVMRTLLMPRLHSSAISPGNTVTRCCAG